MMPPINNGISTATSEMLIETMVKRLLAPLKAAASGRSPSSM
jgi:hypothetical protein